MLRFLLCGLAFCAAGAAQAGDRVGAGLSVGTLGGQADVRFKINDFVTARGGYNYLEFSYGEVYDGVDYDADIEFSNFGAFADLHPFRNSFVISAGVYSGDKSVSLDATPTENVEIGGQIFTPAEVGVLTGTVEMEDVAPFVGLGFSNAFTGRRINFSLLAGVMATGSPEVTLEANGGLLDGQPLFEAEVQQEAQNLEDDISEYEYFPVVMAGFNFRF